MNLVLNHGGFGEHLIIKRELLGGIQYVFRFGNNYGASVVKHSGSYGSDNDLWELAVLKFYGPGAWDWNLDYDTEITDDVLGYLEEADVREILEKIKGLENSNYVN